MRRRRAWKRGSERGGSSTHQLTASLKSPVADDRDVCRTKLEGWTNSPPRRRGSLTSLDESRAHRSLRQAAHLCDLDPSGGAPLAVVSPESRINRRHHRRGDPVLLPESAGPDHVTDRGFRLGCDLLRGDRRHAHDRSGRAERASSRAYGRAPVRGRPGARPRVGNYIRNWT